MEYYFIGLMNDGRRLFINFNLLRVITERKAIYQVLNDSVKKNEMLELNDLLELKIAINKVFNNHS